MKQFLTMLIAAIIGGVVSISIYDTFAEKKIIVENTLPPKVINTSSIPADFDFIDASASSIPAVVHIYAVESEVAARERIQKERRRRRGTSLFEQFFGGDNFIFGDNFYQKEGSGSGVIISGDGYIVTNNHVVGFADNITVTLSDGKQYKGQKVGSDNSTDLSVIKIEADALPYLEFGNSDKIRVGEWVLAVGNPFSYLRGTVTAGIISAKVRELNIINEDTAIEEFLQTDAAVNPGNSGGALVNVEGKLIGINTAIATPTGVYAGYSFAIPSNLARSVVNDIIERGGDIDRHFSLGIAGYDVDADVKNEFSINADYGFYIDEVDRGGAAQMSGILPGDIVVAVNDEKVFNYDDIKNKIKLNKVGDVIVLTVERKGKRENIRIKLRNGM